MDPMSSIGQAHYRRSRLKMKLTLPANPLADIEPSAGFGIAMVTTARTRELMTIPTPNRTTDVTALAGVLRRMRFNWYGHRKRLVPNELLQLVERPEVTILSGIRLVFLSLPGVLANARKVFESEATTVVNGKLNDVLGTAGDRPHIKRHFFTLEGVKGLQRPFISWLLEQCGELPESELLTDDAAELMASRLVTPLQIIQYLDLGFEEA